MNAPDEPSRKPSFREQLHAVIFEAESPAGKAFDVVLLLAIGLSVTAMLLESVVAVREAYGGALHLAEWTFTALFTAEYLLRLYCVRRPWAYATSFYGIVDLLAVVPAYLSLLLSGAQSLAVVRALRLLRVFRVLKLARYLGEANILLAALRASRPKIVVFLVVIVNIAVIVGAAMYLIEGDEAGFTSIPASVYWAVVTMTTVGYGDIAPQTPLGQALAVALMVTGYGIIAVPTGIVTSELTRLRQPLRVTTQACPACSREGHDFDAKFCKHCGAKL